MSSLEAAEPSLPRSSSRVAAATSGDTTRSERSCPRSTGGTSSRFARHSASRRRARAASMCEMSEIRKSESSRGGHQDMSRSSTRTVPGRGASGTGVAAGHVRASSLSRATLRA